MARRDVIDVEAVKTAAGTVAQFGGVTDMAMALQAVAAGDWARLFRLAGAVESAWTNSTNGGATCTSAR